MAWWQIGFTCGIFGLMGSAYADLHKSAHKPPASQHAPQPSSVWSLDHSRFGRIPTTAPIPRPARVVLKVLNHGSLVSDLKSGNLSTRNQTTCLALALYHEARGQSNNERIAVAQVVFNRMVVSHGSICATIWAHQGADFPWAKRSLREIIPHEIDVWEEVQYLAIKLSRHRPADITRGATFFYNPKLCKPNWAQEGEVTLRLQNIFIRM